MTPLLTLIVYAVGLAFVAILLAAVLRNREWTAEGMRVGLSNRDDLPEATPLGGRAVRAANNTIEALILFTPLALVAHAAGLDSEALFGAQLFLGARVVYLPIYLAGITVVRSLVWGVGVLGLILMAIPLL